MKRIFPAIVVAFFAAAAFFCIDRYVFMTSAKAALAEKQEGLAKAKQLYSANPHLFGTSDKSKIELKVLVQEASARTGVSLSFLTETEKEIGDGIKEKNVQCRAVNVPQAKLVSFLADLESRSGGARIKELRLKPAAEQSDVFQEAESVLAVRYVIGSSTKKVERRDD